MLNISKVLSKILLNLIYFCYNESNIKTEK